MDIRRGSLWERIPDWVWRGQRRRGFIIIRGRSLTAPLNVSRRIERSDQTPSLAPVAEILAHQWGVVSNRFLDLLFPPRCVGCRRFVAWLCDDCIAGMRRVEAPFCLRCGTGLPSGKLCARCRHQPPRIDGIRSVFHFESTLREAVHRFKYDGLAALATPLGELMAGYLREHPLPADVLVPVPLHPARVRNRGYNQSALLVQAMALNASVPVDTHSLVRKRATLPQVGLNIGERVTNVAGAFSCTSDALVGTDVLLVDDVCTSGATLESCAVALREAGTRSIRALTLARANFGDDAR